MKEVFEIRCHHCHAAADAMQSDWCHCVAKKPSIVCARCGACWCTAPQKAQDAFWQYAPGELHEAREAVIARRKAALRRNVTAKKTVMIVDDDEEIREITAHAVEELGYQAVTVERADLAVSTAMRMSPDLVITDALMPRLDGRVLCGLLKDAMPEIPVVIMTSLYTSLRYKLEAYRDFGADEYLTKPINFAQLREVLTTLAPMAA